MPRARAPRTDTSPPPSIHGAHQPAAEHGPTDAGQQREPRARPPATRTQTLRTSGPPPPGWPGEGAAPPGERPHPQSEPSGRSGGARKRPQAKAGARRATTTPEDGPASLARTDSGRSGEGHETTNLGPGSRRTGTAGQRIPAQGEQRQGSRAKASASGDGRQHSSVIDPSALKDRGTMRGRITIHPPWEIMPNGNKNEETDIISRRLVAAGAGPTRIISSLQSGAPVSPQ
ncbi:proline-rich protein HaeIII subfamily 1 [Brachypodium distachyon]|uniref:proline-rich protein HaeIII subfamily 1 n=1 Tax=Brachypodium distachyon TaxID=15368 RepID=UPI00071E577F|nr:proline-rich protein HaeIII subfamily 1 [Brachypodium distachyon]|eukprot:XP_010235457.2 proline-rich protein HaeIII subfamily 1 [Brachypodium distachyon]